MEFDLNTLLTSAAAASAAGAGAWAAVKVELRFMWREIRLVKRRHSGLRKGVVRELRAIKKTVS